MSSPAAWPSTALHIGGGTGTLSPSDSPVVRGPDGLPFIPGSSFKDPSAMLWRSWRLAAASELQPAARRVSGRRGDAQRDLRHQAEEERWTEAKLVTELEQRLCDTCKLFGSVFRSSRIFFDDLPLVEWAGATQIRDGVGIDRDTEKARDRLKYDFEVVPPDAAFSMRVSLENPSTTDLALACIGFSGSSGASAASGASAPAAWDAANSATCASLSWTSRLQARTGGTPEKLCWAGRWRRRCLRGMRLTSLTSRYAR